MATLNWLARATPRAQINTIVIGGTVATNDTFTITINGKSITHTAASSDKPTIAAALVALAAAMTAAEYTRITWTVNSATITATGKVAGMDHVLTTAKSSASGTITDGATSVTTTASGPNDWNAAANWDTGSVPVNSDNVNIDLSRGSILTGLDQSAVTLASLRVFSSSQTGNVVGLAELNADGYTEYREKFLKIKTALLEVDAVSPRINIDLSSVACEATIYRCGTSGIGNVPAMRLRGSSSSNVIRLHSGYLGLAYFDDETFTCATLDTLGTGARIEAGQGFTATTITLRGAASKFIGVTATTINVQGGSLELSAFSATNLNGYLGAVITVKSSTGTPALSLDRARLVVQGQIEPGTIMMSRGAAIEDPNNLFVWSGDFSMSGGTLSISA
jgi:hypothetical protein